MWSLLTFLLLNGVLVYCQLPPEIEKCEGGDSKCIVDVINYIFRNYPKGIPDMGLTALDSIDLKDIVVSEGIPNTPMQMNLKFNTVTLRGFENTTILRAKGFEKQLQHGLEVSGWTPVLRLDGLYEVNGNLLMIPIQGKGPAQIEFKDGQFMCKLNITEDQRTDGKLYVQIAKVKCLVDTKGMHVKFENLMNDKVLSEAMNELINNNWQTVWQTIRKGVNSAVSQVAIILLTPVLNKFSYDDFFKAT